MQRNERDRGGSEAKVRMGDFEPDVIYEQQYLFVIR